MAFYAYVHCKPDGTPFYVGKGMEKRLLVKKRPHNPRHVRTLKKYGEENILVGSMECSTESIAFDLEMGLIKRFRAMGLDLTNLTSGGEGASGAIRSPETKAKMSLAQMGNKKGLGKPRSEETRRLISNGKIGNQWNVGRKYSVETKRKKSRSLGGSPVECEKDGVSICFYSISEAAEFLGLNSANITNHLKAVDRAKRKLKGIGGWIFKRVQNDHQIR